MDKQTNWSETWCFEHAAFSFWFSVMGCGCTKAWMGCWMLTFNSGSFIFFCNTICACWGFKLCLFFFFSHVFFQKNLWHCGYKNYSSTKAFSCFCHLIWGSHLEFSVSGFSRRARWWDRKVGGNGLVSWNASAVGWNVSFPGLSKWVALEEGKDPPWKSLESWTSQETDSHVTLGFG